MLQRTLLFLFLPLMLCISIPTSANAVVTTPDTVANRVPEKKIGFWKKVKMLKKFKKEHRKMKREMKKSGTSAAVASGIWSDGLFRAGVILLLGGIVIAAFTGGIIAWLAGLVSLVGFILLFIAVINWFS